MDKYILQMEAVGLADGYNEGMEEKEIQDNELEFSLKQQAHDGTAS